MQRDYISQSTVIEFEHDSPIELIDHVSTISLEFLLVKLRMPHDVSSSE